MNEYEKQVDDKFFAWEDDMKKKWFACIALVLIVFSFQHKSYAQELSDKEAESLISQEQSECINGTVPLPVDNLDSLNAIHSKMESHGRSSTSFSSNPADLAPLLGTKWQFIHKIGSSIFTDEITFKTVTTQVTSTAIVECTNQYDSEGIGTYGNLTDLLGGYGFGVTISGVTLDHFYFFRISGDTATGYYNFKTKSTGTSSSTYALTGIRISGPSGNISDSSNNTDMSNCKIMPKSMSINNTSIPTTNDYVNFTVDAISDCSATLYYYYSYAPDYGTDDYGKSEWVKMVSRDNGFSSSNTVSYKFPASGYYVVVAWISPQMAPSDPINMIGCTVAVK